MINYTISTITGDIPYSYTYEQVHVTLVGTKGLSKELLLEKPLLDGFKCGHIDDFAFQNMPDLGELTHVQIRLTPIDPTTSYVKAWFLERVHIVRKEEDRNTLLWTCECGKWFGTDASQQLSYILPVTTQKRVKKSQCKKSRKIKINNNNKKKRSKLTSATRHISLIAANNA